MGSIAGASRSNPSFGHALVIIPSRYTQAHICRTRQPAASMPDAMRW
jgi:hypothetical protein